MGVFRVAIFTPRRVEVLRVRRRWQGADGNGAVVGDERHSVENASSPPRLSLGASVDGGQNDNDGEMLDANDFVATSCGSIRSSNQHHPIDVVSKIVREPDGNDCLYEVAFRVQGIGRGNGHPDPILSRSAPASSSSEAAESPSSPAPPPPIFPRQAAPSTSSSLSAPMVINVEEQLRLLLLETIPCVRCTWTRCNGIRNMGDEVDDDELNYLEVVFHAKRRTAMVMAQRALQQLGIGRDYGHVSIIECDFFRPMMINSTELWAQKAQQQRNGGDGGGGGSSAAARTPDDGSAGASPLAGHSSARERTRKRRNSRAGTSNGGRRRDRLKAFFSRLVDSSTDGGGSGEESDVANTGGGSEGDGNGGSSASLTRGSNNVSASNCERAPFGGAEGAAEAEEGMAHGIAASSEETRQAALASADEEEPTNQAVGKGGAAIPIEDKKEDAAESKSKGSSAEPPATAKKQNQPRKKKRASFSIPRERTTTQTAEDGDNMTRAIAIPLQQQPQPPYAQDDAGFDIEAQMRFDKVLANICSNSLIDFDFMAFLFISTIVGGLGLATNSPVSVLAAALLSPMMGPILATVMGTILVIQGSAASASNSSTISSSENQRKRRCPDAENDTCEENAQDQSQEDHNSKKKMSMHYGSQALRLKGLELLKQGFKVEAMVLVIALLVGFVIGLAFWGTDTRYYGWTQTGTDQMRNRTAVSILVVGIFIAFCSGAGLVLSLLGSKGNSLVGVALNASLLPPVVNTGMYFALAIRSKNAQDNVQRGLISLALTLINVAGIYVAALAMFFAKRFTPFSGVGWDFGPNGQYTTGRAVSRGGILGSLFYTYQDNNEHVFVNYSAAPEKKKKEREKHNSGDDGGEGNEASGEQMGRDAAQSPSRLPYNRVGGIGGVDVATEEDSALPSGGMARVLYSDDGSAMKLDRASSGREQAEGAAFAAVSSSDDEEEDDGSRPDSRRGLNEQNVLAHDHHEFIDLSPSGRSRLQRTQMDSDCASPSPPKGGGGNGGSELLNSSRRSNNPNTSFFNDNTSIASIVGRHVLENSGKR